MLVGIALYICVQLALAFLSPVALVYFCLLTSALPVMTTETQIDTPIGHLDLLAVRVLGLALSAAVALIANFQDLPARLGRHKWHVMFLLVCAASIAYAPSGVFGVRMLLKLSAPLLFCWLVVVAIKTEAQLLKMEQAIIASGIVITIAALISRAFGITSDPNASISGVSGLGPPGMGPPVFAAHMLPFTMLVLAAFVTQGGKWRAALAIMGALCVVATVERISIAAVGIGCSAVLFVGTRGFTRFVVPLAALIGAPLLFLFNSTLRGRMFYGDVNAQSLMSDPGAALENLNGSGRFGLWSQVLDQFFYPHPLLGSGLGATQDLLYTHSYSGVGVVHSEYVRLLSEVGLLGTGLFAVTVIVYLLICLRGVGAGNALSLRKYSMAALGALVAYLVYMATDNGLDYVGQFGMYVFALIGMKIKAAEVAVASSSPAAGEAVAAHRYRFANLMS